MALLKVNNVRIAGISAGVPKNIVKIQATKLNQRSTMLRTSLRQQVSLNAELQMN